MKFWQAWGSIRLEFDPGIRCVVDEGLNPARAGTTRALRFWVMESSMDDLDNRRKSAKHGKPERHIFARSRAIPRRATDEKQNCGDRLGVVDDSAMASSWRRDEVLLL